MSLKQLKEQFVSDLSGGSIAEVYAVTAISLAAFFSQSLVKKWVTPNITVLSGQPLVFLEEFFFDVLLQLQAITIFSNRVSQLYVNALLPALLVFVYKVVTTTKRTKRSTKTSTQKELLGKVSYITAYRAQMMVLTNLAILAVDFHAFPRRFAKVETWGTSLMDLGVGLFVFSMGLANSRALIKKAIAPTRKEGYLGLVWRNTVKACPVLALGVIRLASVKSLEYQEHETEYGVHWNFFMTLGLLPVFLGVADPIFAVVPRFFVALAIGIGYEAALQTTDLTRFILDDSNRRENLLTMNKEGLCSFFGYLSIFIFGQSFGSFIFTSRKTPNNLIGTRLTGKGVRWLTVTSTQGLLAMSAITLIIFYVCQHSFLTGNISRRLANFPYVMWVVNYNAIFLLGYNLIERVVGPVESRMLNAVNNNGLAIFLVANLTTGLINMTINTLEVGAGMTYAILILYSALWVALALVLDNFGIYIKL